MGNSRNDDEEFITSWYDLFNMDQIESEEELPRGSCPVADLLDNKIVETRKKVSNVKCNCGTEKVYGNVPLEAHLKYCDLRTQETNYDHGNGD